MSRFSIPTRLVVLSAVLLAILILSNLYLTRNISEDAAALGEEAELVSVLKTANAASKAFGDLKYWLTDLAISLLIRSEQKANEARAALAAILDRLAVHDP